MSLVCPYCGGDVNTNKVVGNFVMCNKCKKVVHSFTMISVEEYKNKTRTELIDKMLENG